MHPRLAWQDSLATLGTIYPASYGLAAFGDTDHDGHEEIFMTVDFIDSTSLVTLEVEDEATYTDVASLQTFFVPYAVGDLDGDGRSEVVGQTSFSIDIFEASDPTTHPAIPSWSSPPLSNIIGRSAIGDTDCDGRMEIIHSINPSRLVIYENKGDDTFEQRYFHQGPFQDQSRKVIADLDGDGVPEIAVSGHQGILQIFESIADDTWVRTYVESTGRVNAYGLAGGLDTDGNGRPELFLVGDRWPPEFNPVRNVCIYEATSNDTYVRVATLVYDDQHIGGLFNAIAVANVDEVGLPEALVRFYRVLIRCRAVAPGQWVLELAALDPSTTGQHTSVYAHDLNLNSRPEIFWLTDANIFLSSLVLEHPGVSPVGAVPHFELDPLRLEVWPNPARDRATIRLLGDRTRATQLTVIDAAGRLVRRHALPHESTRTFSLPFLAPYAGIYFLQLEDAHGRILARGRTTIIR